MGWRVCERAALPDPLTTRAAARCHTPSVRSGRAHPHHAGRSRRQRPRRARRRRARRQGGRSARPGDDRRAHQHGRRHGPTGTRPARRRDRHRRPHRLSPGRAARVVVAARRRPQAGVHPGRRPGRQAGAACLAGPVPRRRRPSLHGGRPARPLPRAAPRRHRRAHRARRHRSGHEPARVADRRSPGDSPPAWYDEGDLLARAAISGPGRAADAAVPRWWCTCPSASAHSRSMVSGRPARPRSWCRSCPRRSGPAPARRARRHD